MKINMKHIIEIRVVCIYIFINNKSYIRLGTWNFDDCISISGGDYDTDVTKFTNITD